MTEDDFVVGHVPGYSYAGNGEWVEDAGHSVRMSYLTPEVQVLLRAALAMWPGGLGGHHVTDAARAFAKSVKGGA